jgi:hypothetical protein
MKIFICAAIAASVLAIPAAASAQQANAPITRAQVRAELLELEQAGYDPSGSDWNYPDDLQAAEQRVQAKHLAQNAAAPLAPSGSVASAKTSTALSQ